MRALLIVAACALLSFGTACGSAAKKPASDATSTPADEGAPKWDSSSETASAPSGSSGSPSGGSTPGTASTVGPSVANMQAPKARSGDVYDKEHTDIVLKRAARQVKENCGSAKDEDGKAPGPWGKATAAVVLGHNGHSRGVTVGPPYDGTPAGRCILQAFANLTFPPWSGPDTTINWELELVQPKP